MTEESGKTRDVAESAMRKARAHLLADNALPSAVTEALLADVLREAWRTQFDDDESQLKAQLRTLVRDAVDHLSSASGAEQ